jgi:SAM-dependent methyltransferase
MLESFVTKNVNFVDLDSRCAAAPGGTPRQLVGVYPLGGGGAMEAPYRHFFELRHFLSIAPLRPDMSVLELGSGNGRWALSIAPLVQTYTGVDLSPRAVEIAREDAASRGLRNVDFRELSILDFRPDRAYDLIYFSGVSQYLEDEQLGAVLQNLSPGFKPDTLIIDRSTVNYRAREILRRENYYSILRTPEELRALFAERGFRLDYCRRSYRFLRGARFLTARPWNRLVTAFVLGVQPLSLWLLYGFSWLADTLHPIPFEGGDRSHDFLVFRRGNAP